MVLKVLFLYMPLPMFWTLFDQKVTQGFFFPSRWFKHRFSDQTNRSECLPGFQVDLASHHYERRLCKFGEMTPVPASSVSTFTLLSLVFAGCLYHPAGSDAGQFVHLSHADSVLVMSFIWGVHSSSLFSKDFQPHPDPDSGAHHGQPHLPSHQEMWLQLHVGRPASQAVCCK